MRRAVEKRKLRCASRNEGGGRTKHAPVFGQPTSMLHLQTKVYDSLYSAKSSCACAHIQDVVQKPRVQYIEPTCRNT